MIKAFSKITKATKSTSRSARYTTKNSRRKKNSQPIGPVNSFYIDGLTHDGKGVARASGKVTFIAGALPKETVQAQVFKSNRRFDEAKLVAVVEASEYRVNPPCAHYETCGGCSFQHLEIKQQRVSKKLWLQGQLRKVCEPDDISLLADAALGYRRRARLSVRVNQGQLALGFRALGSNKIVSIDNCIVLTPRLQQLLGALKTALVHDDSLAGLADKIGHIELLEDDKGASILFRLTANLSSDYQERWAQWAQPQNIDLYWQFAEQDSALVAPEAKRYFNVEGLKLNYHPQDFIQVNGDMNQKMIAQAMDWLAPNKDDTIVDLFCGVGNFSLPLASRAKKVVGVEVQESMVAAGIANAKTNNLDNLSFIAADLTKAANKEISSLGVTKVLLDPPRAGAFEFLPTIVKLKPKSILYVSCDAATLARDAEYLVSKGYKVMRGAMMDMFPQTAHVETMLLFSK
ncbi:23S rRNA (uracil(1939)-C(5))-methyltransferase RlmD [Paraglaciecola sp. 2405UD69-4]|uniref:23S rRNA (uracil(1939)-C(5))-methyltransferase RlmD n=1 Tax=Paraglaciecola sp. 2405UD69-4 TaxID=3391836 RepID=UPI0039C99AE0